jgi:hypothetical protein
MVEIRLQQRWNVPAIVTFQCCELQVSVRIYGLCDKEYMSRQYWLTCKDWEEKERGLGNEKNYGYQMMQ